MKAIYSRQQLLYRLYAFLAFSLVVTILSAQTGSWQRMNIVREKKTNLQELGARCLPNCSFNGQADDMGMSFEFKYYSSVDRKYHSSQGHVKWIWKNPTQMIPGEKISVRAVISNTATEYSFVTAYAKLNNWGFMKPESGKSGDESAKAGGSAVMTGVFEVPKQAFKPDGTPIPELTLTFLISGGNEQKYVERTIVYKWVSGTSPAITPGVIKGDWNTQANNFNGNVGSQYTYYFPPGGTISGRVWGTDIYTTDCSIASAAVHAGLITTKDGGTVTIEIRGGQGAYKGSTRNGVSSKDWGAYGSSFVFVANPGSVPPVLIDANAIRGDWNTQANEFAGNFGKRYTYYFPPGGTISARVWGTDIYTYDCSIASAAVHAGLITAKDGGTVTIEIRPGESSYKGSVRNGVTSKDWGAYGGSFIFVTGPDTRPPVVIDADAIRGDWNTQADAYASNTGKQYKFYFPPWGTISGRVWGTDVYTTDCSIATAAVHAGLITKESGGTVIIEIRGAQPSFKGSTRNGVTSRDWGSYGASFVFVRPTVY